MLSLSRWLWSCRGSIVVCQLGAKILQLQTLANQLNFKRPSFNINFWSLKTKQPHIFASHFSQCHIFELEVLSLPKACYSNARHQFCTNSALLPLRAILHLIKNCNTKGAYPSVKYDCLHVSPLYQNSDLIESKVYYSNRRYQLWIN